MMRRNRRRKKLWFLYGSKNLIKQSDTTAQHRSQQLHLFREFDSIEFHLGGSICSESFIEFHLGGNLFHYSVDLMDLAPPNSSEAHKDQQIKELKGTMAELRERVGMLASPRKE